MGGFHGWYHFYLLEKLGHINYLGYWDQASFGDNMVVSITFIIVLIRPGLKSYFKLYIRVTNLVLVVGHINFYALTLRH